MKTTVEIPDPVFEKLKARAAREKKTMRAIINAALVQFLSCRKNSDMTSFKLKDCSVGGEGLQPGIQEGDWRTLRDLIYDGHGA